MTPLFNEGQGEKQRRQGEDGGGEDQGCGDGTGSLEQCRRRLMGGSWKEEKERMRGWKAKQKKEK